MPKNLIIYRACAGISNQQDRPGWFNKKRCWDNFYFNFGNKLDTQIIVVWDGDKDGLYWHIILTGFWGIKTIEINTRNNGQSMEFCYDLAKQSGCENIYFTEDDYLYQHGSNNLLWAGIEKFGLFTLYHHPDRIFRTDDITKNSETITILNKEYIRTSESTTYTFGIKKDLFLEFYRLFEENCSTDLQVFRQSDREVFRELARSNVRLFNPINSFATHCHNGYLGLFVDWERISRPNT